MAAFHRALRILDEVQHLPQLEKLDPAAVIAAVRDEVDAPGATLEAIGGQLDALRGLLADVDRFAQKSMRIRLLHVTDALPPQLRTLIHSTVVSYERDLPLLRQRIAGALRRFDPSTATAAADHITDAAGQVLALRATLRQGVLEAARALAAACLPAAERAARDRSQPDEQRERWKRARVDLEQLAAAGERLLAGSFSERLDRMPAPEDPPEPERPDRFSLLEID